MVCLVHHKTRWVWRASPRRVWLVSVVAPISATVSLASPNKLLGYWVFRRPTRSRAGQRDLAARPLGWQAYARLGPESKATRSQASELVAARHKAGPDTSKGTSW